MVVAKISARFLFAASVCYAAVSPAMAQLQASEDKENRCPNGYYADGRLCIPIRDPDRPTLSVGGQCPSGYRAKGKYCAPPRNDSRQKKPEISGRGGAIDSGGAGER